MGAAVLAGAGLVGFAAGTLLSIYAAVFLLGLGWNLCHIAGSALLSDELISQERGRVQGITEVVVGVTVAVGSLASGSIYGGYGYTGANAAVLCIVAVLALAVFVARWAEARGATIAPELGGAPPG
jgi:MFS family permease